MLVLGLLESYHPLVSDMRIASSPSPIGCEELKPAKMFTDVETDVSGPEASAAGIVPKAPRLAFHDVSSKVSMPFFVPPSWFFFQECSSRFVGVHLRFQESSESVSPSSA